MMGSSRNTPNRLIAFGVTAAVCSPLYGVSMTLMDAGCHSDSCAQNQRCQIQQCNDNYNAENPNPNNPYGNPTYNDAGAYETCLDAAGQEREACDDLNSANGDPDLLYPIWEAFREEMIACFEAFGPEGEDPEDRALQSCIAGALSGYEHAVDQLLNPPPDGCSGGVVPQGHNGMIYAGPMGALQAAAQTQGQTDGKYLTAVNTTLRVTAGVNITAGDAYDASQMPCIKQALLTVIYQTKDGPAMIDMDADTDTSDGTSFDVILFGDKLIDTREVYLVCTFYDAFDVVRFAEIGALKLMDSPLSGDWNRDEVANTQDVLEFLGSYNAQTNRSDLNGDGMVGEQDVAEFLGDYTE